MPTQRESFLVAIRIISHEGGILLERFGIVGVECNSPLEVCLSGLIFTGIDLQVRPGDVRLGHAWIKFQCLRNERCGGPNGPLVYAIVQPTREQTGLQVRICQRRVGCCKLPSEWGCWQTARASALCIR